MMGLLAGVLMGITAALALTQVQIRKLRNQLALQFHYLDEMESELVKLVNAANRLERQAGRNPLRLVTAADQEESGENAPDGDGPRSA